VAFRLAVFRPNCHLGQSERGTDQQTPEGTPVPRLHSGPNMAPTAPQV
jgi:hypothetical protein